MQISFQLTLDTALQVLCNLLESVRSSYDFSGNSTNNFVLASHPEDALTEISTNQSFKRPVHPHQKLASLASIRLYREQLLPNPEKRNFVLFEANSASQLVVAQLQCRCDSQCSNC